MSIFFHMASMLFSVLSEFSNKDSHLNWWKVGYNYPNSLHPPAAKSTCSRVLEKLKGYLELSSGVIAKKFWLLGYNVRLKIAVHGSLKIYIYIYIYIYIILCSHCWWEYLGCFCSRMYYFIVIDILFYCDIFIILLC